MHLMVLPDDARVGKSIICKYYIKEKYSSNRVPILFLKLLVLLGYIYIEAFRLGFESSKINSTGN